ncbi:MAG: MFS transporter [Oscillospiraceae bacterium]|nr:MFS transporter [Oscillospiraceae bacterium]
MLPESKLNEKPVKNSKNKKFYLSFFKEPSAKPQIQESKEKIKRKYMLLRNLIFTMSYVIYLVSYVCRKSLSIAGPFSNINFFNIGIISSLGAFVYGIAKFINGIFADKGNVRTSLSFNIIMVGIFSGSIGILNCFELKNNQNLAIVIFSLLWGISNWFHAALFPYCAKSLVRWFPNKTRARWWAFWSTSHELGSFLAMNITLPIGITVQRILGFGGLEAMFIFPSLLAIIVGILGFFALKDRPVSLGLPDVEEICNEKSYNKVEKENEIKTLEEKFTYFETLKKYVLKNKIFWNLAAVYFFVYIFRMGPVNWIFSMLVTKNQNSHISFKEATEKINYMDSFLSSIICLVGFAGTLFAPVISEKIFKGKRAPANFWCLIFGMLSMAGIWFGLSSSFSATNEILRMTIFIICLGISGFSVCVPQVLVGGICAIEFSCKKVAAAASGFTGLIGYLGFAFGELANGFLKQTSQKYFADDRLVLIFWATSALLGALLCLPLWNVKAK